MSVLKHRVQQVDGKYVPVVEVHYEGFDTEGEALDFFAGANAARGVDTVPAKTHVCGKDASRAVIEALKFYAYGSADEVSLDGGEKAQAAIDQLLGRSRREEG